MRLWNTDRSGEALTFDHPTGARQIAFSADGRQLITLHGATARFTPCDVCGPIDEVLTLAGQRTTRDFTPEERAKYLRAPGWARQRSHDASVFVPRSGTVAAQPHTINLLLHTKRRLRRVRRPEGVSERHACGDRHLRRSRLSTRAVDNLDLRRESAGPMGGAAVAAGVAVGVDVDGGSGQPWVSESVPSARRARVGVRSVPSAGPPRRRCRPEAPFHKEIDDITAYLSVNFPGDLNVPGEIQEPEDLYGIDLSGSHDGGAWC